MWATNILFNQQVTSDSWILIKVLGYMFSVYTPDLKVLSSEMDQAEIRLIRYRWS